MSRPRALITGASAGIGAALARRLAEEDHDLVLCADDPGVRQTAQELERFGGEVVAEVVDLRDPTAVASLVERTGVADRLDVLVLNAGIGVGGGTFVETSLEGHLDVVDLNVRSVVQLAGLLTPPMTRRGHGRVMITSSMVASMPGPYQTTYNASKAFLANFAAGLRHELRRSGVTVTTLLPGPVETGFFRRAGMEDTLLGRMIKEPPELVARQGVAALLAGRPGVIGGRLISVPSAVLIKVLPGPARTRLQAVLSRPLPFARR